MSLNTGVKVESVFNSGVYKIYINRPVTPEVASSSLVRSAILEFKSLISMAYRLNLFDNYKIHYQIMTRLTGSRGHRDCALCIIDSLHAVRDSNGRACNRTAHLEGRAKMMQAWTDYLDELRLQ